MTSQDMAALIGKVFAVQVSNYCANAGSVLVVYEYVITLGREVELFWKGRWTGAAILFFFNRYLSLIVVIYGLTGDAPISAQTHFAKGLTGIIDPVSGCISSDNVSPDLSKSRMQLYPSCHTPSDLMRCLVTIISRTCLITADLLLVCITWASLYRKGGLRDSLQMNRFIAVLLLDGTIYFVVLLVLNTMHLTLSMLSVEYDVQNVSYVTQFSEPYVSSSTFPPPPPPPPRPLTPAGLGRLSSSSSPGRITTVLISRFLLHLQSANRKASNPQGMTTISIHDAAAGGLVFEHIIGSLGSSIDIASLGDRIYQDTFDEGRDEAPLTIQVKDLASAAGKDGLDSGVDSEGRSGTEMSPLTPMSLPRSPGETSDSEGMWTVESTQRHTRRSSLGPLDLEA
ncbi:hypothetical protein GSI_14345 [Ganoderma sinense ZZ0214-1]|uniref:DUF6533 domain-containing protein n=1 Tax=Ganoderma sinense ZZ0214-1 TaxID=1077348 RepID=A0A2G8RNX5_9APHY|nr:hypothetical protein GSI_14345 [Ganoderma sinense ZZ0214-1]